MELDQDVERMEEEDETESLRTQVAELQLKLEQKTEQNNELEQKLVIERFGVFRFTRDPSLIQFYTGFRAYDQFLAFFEWVKPAAQTMSSVYHERYTDISLAGAPRSMQLIDELFMFLCRLRVGLKIQDLAVRFNTSVSTVSRKVITWANFLYCVLGRIPIWLKERYSSGTYAQGYKRLVSGPQNHS